MCLANCIGFHFHIARKKNRYIFNWKTKYQQQQERRENFSSFYFHYFSLLNNRENVLYIFHLNIEWLFKWYETQFFVEIGFLLRKRKMKSVHLEFTMCFNDTVEIISFTWKEQWKIFTFFYFSRNFHGGKENF